jgi:hypothetical protein
MPPAKRRQSDAMLYTLITFVGLFIASTVFAVIYYVKAEEQRTNATTLQTQINELATSSELMRIGEIVGTQQAGKSRLATMVDYLDQMIYLIRPEVIKSGSAQVKANTANAKTKATLNIAQQYTGTIDPNTTGLLRVVENLKSKLDFITGEEAARRQELTDLQKRFDDAIAASFEKEQALLAEKENLQQQVNKIKQDYAELEALLRQTTDEQVQTLRAQLQTQEDNYNKEHADKLKLQAELKMTQERMENALAELEKLHPPPDKEIAAFEPDGKILLIDDRSKVVHINKGKVDRVYPGLTFSVYNKNMPIPRDGQGKAEIEVYDVDENISTARIIRSDVKKAIVLGDIVANLIWDSDKVNLFAVAGEFDLNNDGFFDPDAIDKIKALIEKWGGKTADSVSPNTDFLILGSEPPTLPQPTMQQQEIDPMATQKYDASIQKLAQYNETLRRADVLSIPVFNYERFLCFLGYKTRASQAGAFSKK